MPKDLKIGLAVGLGIVMMAVIWLATRPSLTPEARIQRLHNIDTQNQNDLKSNASVAASEPMPKSRVDPLENNAPPQIVRRENDSTQEPQGALNASKETTIPSQPETVSEPVSEEQSEPVKTERFYIVRKNDTLSSISQKYYGAATQWPKIFEANRQTIPDANKLPIGTKLIIPD